MWLFANLEAEDTLVAQAILAIEAEVYLTMNVDEDDIADRSLTPLPLSAEDVANIDHPNRDPSAAVPISLVHGSPYELALHAPLQLMDDQTAIEHYSPDHYERTFLEGQDCWLDRDCHWLRTHNDLVKKSLIANIPYQFFKDFRWVDLALGADDTEATSESRWAYAARSWTTEEFHGENDANTLLQTYSIEVWLPRDGGVATQPDWLSGPDSGGIMRVATLWSETEISGIDPSSDAAISFLRAGIQNNYDATDDFLEEAGH